MQCYSRVNRIDYFVCLQLSVYLAGMLIGHCTAQHTSFVVHVGTTSYAPGASRVAARPPAAAMVPLLLLVLPPQLSRMCRWVHCACFCIVNGG